MSARHHHAMPFGAELREDGSVRFRLWAPSEPDIALVLHDEGGRPVDALPMEPAGEGWLERVTERAGEGTLYSYRLPNGWQVPDPASRFQPCDAHGPSLVVDPRRYEWQCADWRGRPWEEAVIYELHVGCFTEEGSFNGVRRKLDYLADLGVTAVELMPVADFPGKRNWGYDGVQLFAPDSVYGRPDELKALVDAAHERGLMVLLDVVYNHFGPDGNYLHTYAGPFFTERHHTPWGAAINFDGPEAGPVREFFIHNALFWLQEYRFDGLRFDAVHAIVDDSDPDILVELAEIVQRRIGAAGQGEGRHVHLILENGDNQARYLDRDHVGRPRFYTAQWSDDFHHAVHAALTGESGGYFADFAERPVGKIGRALAEGFVFQGEPSPTRPEHIRGSPSAHLPAAAFVHYLQNHDQVGNRAMGERLSMLVEPAPLRALLALILLAPQPPLLFMGEEWGSSQPFNFFCDFHDELADAVREGRRREFARFPEFADAAARERIPDPNAIETFVGSRLDWAALDDPRHAEWHGFVRSLLHLRRDRIAPRLAGIGAPAVWQVEDERAIEVHWALRDGARLTLVANLSGADAGLFEYPVGDLLFESDRSVRDGLAAGHMPAWTVAWFTVEPVALN